jgi:hypothetical protein
MKPTDMSWRVDETINARLSALRKLAAEAADNGLIPLEVAASIARVHGVGQRGVRLGNWLGSPPSGTIDSGAPCRHPDGQAGQVRYIPR